MSLSQIELVWVRVRMEWECFWVNLREDNKLSESKMAVSESNRAEFKMAAIIKLCQNDEWSFFCAKWLNPWWQNSRWLPSSSWLRMNGFEADWTGLSQSFFAKWLNPRWQNSIWKNSRWLLSLSSVRMNELESDWIRMSQSFVQHGWIQDGRIQYGRIQDGCHH